ncbi:MAG: NosD domain-containing protein, partial [Planctomycetota bacterium]|nr:NosD domain-containing protein [Planctomycetota bacterium]
MLTITIRGANRPTDGLGGNSQQHVFFNRVTVEIKGPSGATVRTLQGSFQLQHPISTQNDTPNNPVWVPFEYTIEWDGMISSGNQGPVPASDGNYSIVATMQTVRFKKSGPGQGMPPDHIIGATSPKSHTVTVDGTAPTISSEMPPDGSLLAQASPTVSATYGDAGSGIDPAGVRLFVDSADVTSGAVVTQAAISYVPAVPLVDGTHLVRLVVRDLAGNESSSEWGFTTDITPPAVFALSPEAGSLVALHKPEVKCSFHDATTQVDPDSITIIFDGTDVTENATIGADGLVFTPAEQLADREYTVQVAVADILGNGSSAQWSFRVVSAANTVTATNGGTVSVADPDSPIFGAYMYVPPEALAQDALVVMTLPATPPAPDAGLFSPSGTTVSIECSAGLLTPVLLTLPYDEAPVLERGLNEAVVRLYHYSPGLADWQMLPYVSTNAGANTVTAQVTSFSEFEPGIPVPTNFAKVSGDNQLVPPNSKFGESMVTRLTDQDGNPLGGWEVKYERTAGAGKFDPPPLAPDPPLHQPPQQNELPDANLAPACDHFTDALGKDFEVKTPGGRTVGLHSTEEVHIFLEASEQIISFFIESVSGAQSTSITMTGLAPSSTLQKFEDSYKNHVAVEVGADGTYAFVQGVAERHHVFFQPTGGTIYVDWQGPSQPVGNWDAATKTLTLTQDLVEPIEIQGNGITLDGANHHITGPGYGYAYGVSVVGKDNVVVKNCEVSGFYTGIAVLGNIGSTLCNNRVSANYAYGIFLLGGWHNSLVSNTVGSNEYDGIMVYGSTGNTLTSNTVSSNGNNGLWLYASSDGNVLSNNTVESNGVYGIYLTNSASNSLVLNTCAESGCFDLWIYAATDAQ